jgi:hypothetical protein
MSICVERFVILFSPYFPSGMNVRKVGETTSAMDDPEVANFDEKGRSNGDLRQKDILVRLDSNRPDLQLAVPILDGKLVPGNLVSSADVWIRLAGSSKSGPRARSGSRRSRAQGRFRRRGHARRKTRHRRIEKPHAYRWTDRNRPCQICSGEPGNGGSDPSLSRHPGGRPGNSGFSRCGARRSVCSRSTPNVGKGALMECELARSMTRDGITIPAGSFIYCQPSDWKVELAAKAQPVTIAAFPFPEDGT